MQLVRGPLMVTFTCPATTPMGMHREAFKVVAVAGKTQERELGRNIITESHWRVSSGHKRELRGPDCGSWV